MTVLKFENRKFYFILHSWSIKKMIMFLKVLKMIALAFDDWISYFILSYPPLGYLAGNLSHAKVPRISHSTLRTRPIPSHLANEMAGKSISHPISFRPLGGKCKIKNWKCDRKNWRFKWLIIFFYNMVRKSTI